jgi:hypothetical protein
MIQFFFTVEDGDGDKSTITINGSDAPGMNYEEAIENAWAIINPLVNGHLVSAGVTVIVDISGLTNAAAAAIADVQEKAEFIFRAIDSRFKATITLPTFVETFLTNTGAGKLVDLTQAAVIAFVDMITDGIADSAGTPVESNPTTSHEEDLFALVTAREAWGKSRR